MQINLNFIYYWAIDLFAIVCFLAFLSGSADLIDLCYIFFVFVPRARKFSTIDNGLIGYIKKNISVSFEDSDEG